MARDNKTRVVGRTEIPYEVNRETLSRLWKEIRKGTYPQIIGIGTSDWHLSSKAPLARSTEPDWFAAMRRPLVELRNVWHIFDQPPILVAGDIFDKWNPSPEVINFALLEIPRCYAVPGNHDLPYHSYDQIKKSAYWTLVEADKITHILPGRYAQVNETIIHGFPHGYEVGQQMALMDKSVKNPLHIAVVHQYIWTNEAKHPNIDQSSYVWEAYLKLRKYGYDCAVFGDNHKGFTILNETKPPQLINCGCLIRRKIDEINYTPMIGLIHDDGSITPYYMDTSEDKWIDFSKGMDREDGDNSEEVIEELMKLADAGVNFRDAVKRYMDGKKIDKSVKEVILECMENT